MSDVGGLLDGLKLTTGTNPTATIALASGQTYNGADFGYVPSGGSGTVGTSVWHDLNANGTFDAGEPPLEGVTLDVYFDTNGNGTFTAGVDNRVRTVTTDAAGNFELLGLPVGRYFVRVTDTAGVTTGLSLVDGTNDGIDNNSQVNPYTVVLSSGTPNNVTADFGYKDDPVTSALSISGTAFIDANVSGTYQSGTELPVQSVVVQLYRVLANGTRRLVGITTTAANGTYTFGDLPAGSYEVRVDATTTAADGFLQTTQTTTGGVQPVTLVAGNSIGNDFGFYSGGVTSTPVTLASFATEGTPSSFTARWQTATEIGNVGFNLWVSDGETWRRVNERMIPGQPGDSLGLRSYETSVSGGSGRFVLLQEVDVKGRVRFHGPFTIGQSYGHKGLHDVPIDWATIGREHAAKVAARRAEARAALVSGGNGALLWRIATDGIHRVTYEQLAAAGLDLAGADPNAIAVTRQGQPVPVRVHTDGAVFEAGSYVELVADALDTLYTDTDVYRLSLDAFLAQRVAVDASSPGGAVETSYREPLRIARQRAYSFSSQTSDPWYDTQILAYTSPASASFDFEPEGKVAGTVSLRVDLWGVTNFVQAPDHHAVLEVNGTEVGDVTFDGTEVVGFTAEVPENVLLPGTNQLRVVLPGDTGVDFDLVDVDGFTVEYQRQLVARGGRLDFTAVGDSFEVTGLPTSDVVVYRQPADTRGAAAPLELLTGTTVEPVGDGSFRVTLPGSLTPSRYLVASTSALGAPDLTPARDGSAIRTGPAAFLIIAHPDFLAGLAPLVQQRQEEGWSVKVADVEDVYAEFGGEVFDPAAIKSYIAYAVANLGTRAVLLVGGDTYDYRNYLGYGGLSFIPSLYAPSGDIVRFSPADGAYADVNGDRVPDVAIGRFPVRTSADVETLVSKTLAYGALIARKSLVLAADGYDAPTHFSFTQASNELAGYVPPSWQLDRIDLDTRTAPEAKTELLGKLNDGVAVTSYMGHSGPTAWTFDGLFDRSDAAGLTNGAQPTAVLQWACWASYYVAPGNDTMAHALLLNAGGGAAAVAGAGSLTETDTERWLGLEVYRRAFIQDALIGQSILDAKRVVAQGASSALLDLLQGWNLLGDPTLGLGGDATGPVSGLPFATGFEDGDRPWSAAVQ